MKRWLPFVVPYVLITVVGLSIWAWTREPEWPRGEPVEQHVDDLDPSTPFTRVTGMAHYSTVVKQRIPSGIFREEQTFYLFPLFASDDVNNRAIRVLVRTLRPPERNVDLEVLTLDGHVTPLTPDKVDYSVEIKMGKNSSYFFTDSMMILEPWRIESEDGVWEQPEE